MARSRKAVLSPTFYRKRTVVISDSRWAEVRKHLPLALSGDTDTQLRSAIEQRCSKLLTENARIDEGAGSASVLRQPGAPLKRLSTALRNAAEIWEEIRGTFHDDRLSDLAMYNTLPALADDIERRVKRLSNEGTRAKIASPFPQFVRDVANCLRKVGLKPGATGRGYEGGGNRTWFQEFMAALQTRVLGDDGRQANSPAAFNAEIAKALRGERKPKGSQQ